MDCEPGAMADPTNDTTQEPTRMIFRAWKASDAEEMTGPRTACTSERLLGTQV